MTEALPTASAAICDRVRDDIVAGNLSFGSRLTLDLLAARYAVGHMPVREALRQLQGEGLVVLTPNRGARVRAVDVEFVRNVFDLRITIEAMLARRAAERIEAGQVARLEALEGELEAAAARRDYASLLALNRRARIAPPALSPTTATSSPPSLRMTATRRPRSPWRMQPRPSRP